MSSIQPAGLKAKRLFKMQKNELQVAIVLLLFAIIGFARRMHPLGSDLAPSYLACRVMADGAPSHLYSRNPALFNHVSDPAWTAAAVEGRMDADNVPPYVQTPLWAYMLEPECTRMSFDTFNELFLLIAMLCFAATVWLVARHWAANLLHPGWIALICAGLYLTEAFQYSLQLTQTHILFVLLSVAALIVARRHPIVAGIALSLAAMVKITPGLLVIYWLVTRQWKAAGSFLVSSIALAAITVVAVGSNLSLAYLSELHQTSNVLLVAFNNQSFAAWWMGHSYPASELFIWRALELPAAVKLSSLGLSLASAVAGGMMDRKSGADQGLTPPYGAVFAMVGTTFFATIAWSHYAVLLIVPVMMMLDATLDPARTRRSWLLFAIVIAVFALNLYPLSYREILMHPFTLHHRVISLVRSQFYAGMLAMAGLGLMSAKVRPRNPMDPFPA